MRVVKPFVAAAIALGVLATPMAASAYGWHHHHWHHWHHWHRHHHWR